MLGLPAGTRLALSRALEPRVKCESTREDGSWMLGWALLEESTVLRFVLSAGRLGRASWSVAEGGVVGRRGSPNLLLRPAWAPGHPGALAGEVRVPAWGLCVRHMRTLGMRGLGSVPIARSGARAHLSLQVRREDAESRGWGRPGLEQVG